MNYPIPALKIVKREEVESLAGKYHSALEHASAKRDACPPNHVDRKMHDRERAFLVDVIIDLHVLLGIRKDTDADTPEEA